MKGKKINKTKVALEIGVGLGLAAAAAGAGYYFYGAPKSSAHRKKAAKWADDLKKDVLKKAKKLQKFDEHAFRVLVDESSKAYERLKSVDESDVRAAAAELKANWKTVEKELSRVAKKGERTAKKAAKVVKKSAKRSVKAVKKATASTKLARASAGKKKVAKKR
jgi:hypothetical protein